MAQPYAEIKIVNVVGPATTKTTTYLIRDNAETLIVRSGLPVPASREEVARLMRWMQLTLIPKVIERYKYRRPGGPDPMDEYRHNGGVRR